MGMTCGRVRGGVRNAGTAGYENEMEDGSAGNLRNPALGSCLEKMAHKSTIEWTDATWNPVRGCTKISPGCAHCYAETFAERFRGVPGHPYEQGFDLRLVPEKLSEPLRWAKPNMIFVNSMSDLFHEGVPDDFVVNVARVMQWRTGTIIRYLPSALDRLSELLRTTLQFVAQERHIWWGVSIENRRHGLPRLEHLRKSPCAVRFISVEPLLEDLGRIDLRGIHWVIVGGESGAGHDRCAGSGSSQSESSASVRMCRSSSSNGVVFERVKRAENLTTPRMTSFPSSSTGLYRRQGHVRRRSGR